MTGPGGAGYTSARNCCPACFPFADGNGFSEAVAAITVTAMDNSDEQAPVELPITGELDLHGFLPSELGELVPHYLRLCRERGLLEVRLVHGRGEGQIRASVHAILGRMPEVMSFSLAAPGYGGNGATMVRLLPLSISPG